MPKKRSVVRGFTKPLQRLYKRVAVGPPLPPSENVREAPATATESVATPKTPADVQRMLAAQAKRQRKAARNLLR